MRVIVIQGIFSDSWLENGTLSDFDLDLVTISVPYPRLASEVEESQAD